MGNVVPFIYPAATGESEPIQMGSRRLRPVYVPDRVHACLLRRIDATMERRRATALMPDDDAAFALWTHERDRGDKLRRALINWLSRPF